MSEHEQKTLRALLEQAASDLDVYKHPDIDEAKERLDRVLEAAGLGSIKRERVVSITEYVGMGGYFEIGTEWSSRGCGQTSEYRLPKAIIDSNDPVDAAKTWRREKAIAEARKEVERCEAALSNAHARLSEATRHA